MLSYDLVLRGGRVIDPSQNIDRITDVAFAGAKVAALGDGLRGSDERNAEGLIVTPGLIDLHTHVYYGGTSLGVDPEAYARRSAVTTLVDTGSAGPGNFTGFLDHVISRSTARIVAYLNISFAGIFGFAGRVYVGECSDQRLLSLKDAVEIADRHRDLIAGIKVRVGRHTSSPLGIMPLEIARRAAETLRMPMMVHIDEPPPTYEEVLALLRRGDVLTHSFRPAPNAPIDDDGRIAPAVQEARRRGIIFDIGHGKGSFSFRTARAMLAQNFQPDCISSDIHALCIDGPVFDLPTTMSKLLSLEMPLRDVVTAVTVNPARAIRRPDLGTLAPGGPGEASVLALEAGEFDLVDSEGGHLRAGKRFFSRGLVIGGTWHDPL